MSKQKGSSFEREIVEAAKAAGLEAKRAWGSNGKAMGEHEEVDVVVEGVRIQCKRRAKIGEFIKPNENVDVQIIREDRGETWVIMPLSSWLAYHSALKQASSLIAKTTE